MAASTCSWRAHDHRRAAQRGDGARDRQPAPKELDDIKRGNRSNIPVGTTITDEVDAFAHCPDPLCDFGRKQRPVRALRDTHSETIGDRTRSLSGGSIFDTARGHGGEHVVVSAVR
jgi:hypothetical protein